MVYNSDQADHEFQHQIKGATKVSVLLMLFTVGHRPVRVLTTTPVLGHVSIRIGPWIDRRWPDESCSL